MKSLLLFSFLFLLIGADVKAQRENVIYEESKVPEYQLPDVLTRFKGGKVKTEKVWFKKQRPDILKWFTEEIYGKLKVAGLIAVRGIEQLFDPVKNMFLPDRFVKGECPKCGAKDQYGDSCEVCGAAYTPTELKNPYSAVSGATPVTQSSEHYFFSLSDPRCAEFLRQWTSEANHLQPEAANKMREWLGEDGDNKLLS